MATRVAHVNVTKDYRLFERSDDNRVVNLKKRKKLVESMKLYGFLRSFPICCVRNGDKHLVVKDGQHRLAIAEQLGLPVYWIEETTDFDVAIVNSTSKTWVLRDYAEKYARNGCRQYATGVEFADRFGVPIGTAFSLLAGTTSFTNIQPEFVAGKFKIKDLEWAECVGTVYSGVVEISPDVRSVRFIEACMACARVNGFDAARIIHNARQCRERLVSYSTRDAFLEMMEYVYNFKRQKTLPLKFLAVQAMRERNCANGGSAKRRAETVGNE